MTTPARYKRRTFADLEAAGYAKGYGDGRADALKEFEEAHTYLVGQDKDALDNVEEVPVPTSIWSRLTGLFKGRP